MKLTQAIKAVEAIINANNALPETAADAQYLVPMLWSLPGEGKSASIVALGEKINKEVISVLFGQFDPAELAGFAKLSEDRSTYERARPFFLPTEGSGIIFLDELPQSCLAAQNIAAQLVNERRIGEHKLPKGWQVVCAGNPMTAKAGTTAMPSHLKDRLTHLDIETDHEGFREYALAKGISAEITGFIKERPEWLQKFDPKQNASPSPRSWERADSIIKLNLDFATMCALLKGQIGEATLADFTGYLKIYRELKTDEIMASPDFAELPDDPAITYALCSALAHRATKGNIKDIVTVIKRFQNKEFSAFCMRDCLARNPELKKEKVVTQWFLTEGKELLL
jgi:hypothetical protein